MIGQRLGPYDIVAKVGVGGMGEVYRAHDASLNRDVAIKVLLPDVANDPDRLARFRREAQVLASLNHPNIAHIYGLEGQAGQAGPVGLVMELVEGPTLAESIHASGAGLGVDEAFAIARQIAAALEAAHEQGIVHRDLKPANIKVKADGTVKVLDFGLAKALEQSPASSLQSPAVGLSMSPTITTPALVTGVGTLLGTAAYMSPEQARGRAVDRRADIWAFGCVLYEMLTGRRAFAGDDVTDTLAAVVRAEPDWAGIGSDVPAVVGMFLRRCLQKDPQQRVADIHDVRLALDGAFELPERQGHTANAGFARGASRMWVAACAVFAAGAVSLAVPALRHLREIPVPVSAETRLDIVTPPIDQPQAFALSRDGRQIAFVSTQNGVSRLWLRSLASAEAQPIAGTEGASGPFWSPDGRSIGFFATTALKRVDAAGGPPQTIAPVAAGQGGTWNTDGVIVFSPSTTQGLMRVAASGGIPVPLSIAVQGQQGQTRPTFLPDGRHLLFNVTGGPNVAGLYLTALDERSAVRVMTSPAPSASSVAAYAVLPSAWLIWVRGTVLVAQQFDEAKGALTGQPVTIANGVGSVSSADTGLIAYRSAAGQSRQLTWVDRSGTAQGTVGEGDATLENPTLSSDGRRIVVSHRSSDNANEDLWLLDGDRTTRFTFDPAADRFPVWSPDGARVVFYSTRNGPGDLFVKPANGSGADEQIPAPDQFKLPTSWSPDGRYLMFQRTDPQTSSDIWILSMGTDHPTASVFLKTPFTERFGTFSPDGRWVAYQSNESGRYEIYVRPFVAPSAGGAPATQWQVSTAGGIMPAWRHDGKELFYLNPNGAMMGASIAVAGPTFVPGNPVTLFATRIYGGGIDSQQGRQYDVSPDGRFLINTMLDETTPPITLLQNWRPPAP